VASKWKDLAHAVVFCYGEKYRKSADYLEQLSNNSIWRNAELKPLPWHSAPPAQGNAHAPLVMHPAVLNSLAPAMPLRAVFGGNRNI
jgi:hypothetical protein